MEQRREMAKFAIETVNHRVKLIIGTSSMVAEEIISFSNYVLGAGADARMNCPGILSAYNWSWRYQEDVLTDDFAEEIRKATVAGKR
jgi:dihydrodipicolinate synthase/N-acetylneuraminate lyase